VSAAPAEDGSAASVRALDYYDSVQPEAIIHDVAIIAPLLHKEARPRRRVPAGSAHLLASARANGLDPHLLSAVIHVESHGNVEALSIKGARGLMQIMPATARAVGLRDPDLLGDPDVNVEAGARELRRLEARFHSLPLVLAAYNAGPGAVARFHEVPPFAETIGYVARVLARYRLLSGAGS